LASKFPDLLDIIYRPDVPIDDGDDSDDDIELITTVHTLADYFDIESIRDESFNFLRRVISSDNINVMYMNATALKNETIINDVVVRRISHILLDVDNDNELIKNASLEFWINVATPHVGAAIIIHIRGSIPGVDCRGVELAQHWSKLLLEIARIHYNDDNFTVETFWYLTSPLPLRVISHDVIIQLLSLDQKIRRKNKNCGSDSGGEEEDTNVVVDDDNNEQQPGNDDETNNKNDERPSFESRCLTALVDSWDKISSIPNVCEILNSSLDKQFVVKLMLASLQKAEMMKNNLQCRVSGAGSDAVNGVYTLDGTHDSTMKYTMHGQHNGEHVTYCIFRCLTRMGRKKWYLSITPSGRVPGTDTDIDFYSAEPRDDGHNSFPPNTGWASCVQGTYPSPTIDVTPTGTFPR
jgi:hypothetical protein